MLPLVLALALPAHALDLGGTVLEDLDGDADLADASPLAAVGVDLYLDAGDGLPDLADSLVSSTTTDGDGLYTFTGLADGTYWVVVHSRGMSPTAGLVGGASVDDVWAEQTWGTAGAHCSDGDGGAIELDAPGPCYGGRASRRSDNEGLDKAEHLFRVELDGADRDDVDAAFSFRVFVHEGDFDPTPGVRTQQGSLRQALLNAEHVAGPDALRFVPVTPVPEEGWWTIHLRSSYFGHDDDGTDLDGTAWCNGWSCPLGEVRDSNPGQIGSGATVGVGPDGIPESGDEHTIPRFERPELALHGSSFTYFYHTSHEGRVANIAFDKVRVWVGADFAWFEDNLIGMQPDGDVVHVLQGTAVTMDGDLDNTFLTHNYIRVDGDAFYRAFGGGDEDVFADNEITAPPRGHTGEHVGIGLYNTDGSARQDVLEHNLIQGMGGAAIELGWYGSNYDQTLVSQNHLVGNGRVAGDLGGIVVHDIGAESRITIQHNWIADNDGPGVAVLDDARNVTITANGMAGNRGPGIDLDGDAQEPARNGAGDGVTPNDGTSDPTRANDFIDSPTLLVAELDGTTLHLEGVVGTEANVMSGRSDLEFFLASDDGDLGEIGFGDGLSVPHGEGLAFLGLCESEPQGDFACDLEVPAALVLQWGDPITGTTWQNESGTSEFGANLAITTPPGTDSDGDGTEDALDLCPLVADPAQLDSDGDGVGDACDRCLLGDDGVDGDGDGVADACDTCDGFDDTLDRDLDGAPDGCDPFTIVAPDPGVPGAANVWTATGGVPDALSWLVLARDNGELVVPDCNGLLTDRDDLTLVTEAWSDSQGDIVFDYDVEATAVGTRAFFVVQPAPACAVSEWAEATW